MAEQTNTYNLEKNPDILKAASITVRAPQRLLDKEPIKCFFNPTPLNIQ